jgi:hypothetical protein
MYFVAIGADNPKSPSVFSEQSELAACGKEILR